MLNNQTFLEESLNANLFYLRTLRDFCINIELSFYGQNEYSSKFTTLATRAQDLGRELITYLNGEVPSAAIEYQIYFTDYTLGCEKLTKKLFNLNLATDITMNQLNLKAGDFTNSTNETIINIEKLNEEALNVATEFISDAKEIKDKLLSNELFSYSYPTLYDFMIRTTELYASELTRLNQKLAKDPIYTIDSEYNYNITIYEIVSFLRGLIDTNATKYIESLDQIITEDYPTLLNAYNTLPLSPENQQTLTNNSINLIRRIRLLIAEMLKELLTANLYFIIEALALDNFYRNVNYFLYILTINTNPPENNSFR